MEEAKKDGVQDKIDYLESLKFTSSRTTRKRKDNPIQIKYEDHETKSDVKIEDGVGDKSSQTPSKFDKNNKKNFQYIFDKIKEMRRAKNAAVDNYGCHANSDMTASKDVQDFQTFVSLIISVQNRDESTFAAVDRLKKFGLTVDNMAKTSEEKILQVLGGVNFNKTKAKNIKRAAEIIIEKYDGKVPMKLEQLLEFPGVGNKIAILLLNTAFNMNIGIGVDTHVHRISNRLGWAHSRTPDETRVELQSFVPKEHWSDINHWLVGFGQQICLPINPKCHECLLNDICPTGKEKMMQLLNGDIKVEDVEVKVTKKRKTNKKDDIQVKEEIIEISVKQEEIGNEPSTESTQTQTSNVPVTSSPQEDQGKKKRVVKRPKTL